MTRHNPEKRAWRGRAYKKGGERVKDVRDKDDVLMNKPTGTHATNATVNALQDLLRDYDVLRAVRDDTEPSTAKYDAIERRLSGMRRQAVKLIHDLNPNDTAWKRTFGLL